MANEVNISKESIVAVAEILESLNLKFLLVGATARDLIAEKYNIFISPRKTNDVDFGVLCRISVICTRRFPDCVPPLNS